MTDIINFTELIVTSCSQRYRSVRCVKAVVFLCAFVSLWLNSSAQLKPLVLKQEQFKHYVDYFNTMEEPNIEQAIPNAKSWEWMNKNIPLFECPQQNFEEIFYYRWWTLRKHIKKTEKGFVFTEFLIQHVIKAEPIPFTIRQ